jgi:hypothetical protein
MNDAATVTTCKQVRVTMTLLYKKHLLVHLACLGVLMIQWISCVRSGPAEARTILLFHTISARPSKQPRMVGSILGVQPSSSVFVRAWSFSKRVQKFPARAFSPPCRCLWVLVDWNLAWPAKDFAQGQQRAMPLGGQQSPCSVCRCPCAQASRGHRNYTCIGA